MTPRERQFARDDVLIYLQATHIAIGVAIEIEEGSRALSIAQTHVDTAILWRREDLALKTPELDWRAG